MRLQGIYSNGNLAWNKLSQRSEKRMKKTKTKTKQINNRKKTLEICPHYTDASVPTLAPPRGMTLGQRYHTLKGLDVGKCHTKFQLSSPVGIKVISCKRNAGVNLHLNLQVNLNLVTNVTYVLTHVRT